LSTTLVSSVDELRTSLSVSWANLVVGTIPFNSIQVNSIQFNSMSGSVVSGAVSKVSESAVGTAGAIAELKSSTWDDLAPGRPVES